MIRAYVILLIILVFILQFSVLGWLFAPGRAPNLFVAFAAGMAVIFGFEQSAGMVIFAGLLMDSVGGSVIGSGTLALTLVLWSIDQIKRVAELRLKKYFFALLLSVLAALSMVFFDALLRSIVEAERFFFQIDNSTYTWQASADYAWKMLYTGLVAWPVYLVLKKAQKPSTGNIGRIK